jgi:hypothetical protein
MTMTPNKNISPPDPTQLDDPKHWRDKAEEARNKAEDMADPEARRIMESVAMAYDRLAELAEQQRLGETESANPPPDQPGH